MNVTLTSSSSFSVSGGDYTETFCTGRRILADCGVDGEVIGTVLSSSYDSSITTVVLVSPVLTENLESVKFGVSGSAALPLIFIDFDPSNYSPATNELESHLEGIDTALGIIAGIEDGENTGDIIRWNAASGAWESCAEPFDFKQINLTPRAEALDDTEGGMYYNSETRSIYVCISGS
jgi:hypothetical protein